MIRQVLSPSLPGGRDEVAVADGQGLRPDHPCPPGPGQEAEHQDGGRLPAALQVAEQHDEQRQRRDDQEYVGEQRQHLVPHAAEEGGGDADDHREDRGHQADEERELEGEPDPLEHLGQHILAALRGAEQVRAVRRVQRQIRRRVLERGVVRHDHRADDGRQDEQAEQHGADLGLGRHPAPAAGPGFFGGQRGGFGADRQDGGHAVASLVRARGSANTMIMSTIRLAISTANVITRKIPCMSG